MACIFIFLLLQIHILIHVGIIYTYTPPPPEATLITSQAHVTGNYCVLGHLCDDYLEKKDVKFVSIYLLIQYLNNFRVTLGGEQYPRPCAFELGELPVAAFHESTCDILLHIAR